MQNNRARLPSARAGALSANLLSRMDLILRSVSDLGNLFLDNPLFEQFRHSHSMIGVTTIET